MRPTRAVINLPKEMKTPSWQIEPRREWHGREVLMLAPGVFRFPEEKSPQYHLINEKYVDYSAN
jgi:hypothetical protein